MVKLTPKENEERLGDQKRTEISESKRGKVKMHKNSKRMCSLLGRSRARITQLLFFFLCRIFFCALVVWLMCVLCILCGIPMNRFNLYGISVLKQSVLVRSFAKIVQLVHSRPISAYVYCGISKNWHIRVSHWLLTIR